MLRFLGVQSPFHINLFTLFMGHRVGKDQYGNAYYHAKKRPGYTHERRWVKYKGAPEASKVPPEWHGWLHHQSDDVPETKGESFRKSWQLPHKVNMTGTTGAYLPEGSLLRSGKRPAATGDYQAWKP